MVKPVMNLPMHKCVKVSDIAMRIHPRRAGTAMDCRVARLPAKSTRKPPRRAPIGFDITPKLAAKQLQLQIVVLVLVVVVMVLPIQEAWSVVKSGLSKASCGNRMAEYP